MHFICMSILHISTVHIYLSLSEVDRSFHLFITGVTGYIHITHHLGGWGGGDGGRGGEIELSAKHLIDLKGESISPPGDREYRLRQPIF